MIDEDNFDEETFDENLFVGGILLGILPEQKDVFENGTVAYHYNVTFAGPVCFQIRNKNDSSISLLCFKTKDTKKIRLNKELELLKVKAKCEKVVVMECASIIIDGDNYEIFGGWGENEDFKNRVNAEIKKLRQSRSADIFPKIQLHNNKSPLKIPLEQAITGSFSSMWSPDLFELNPDGIPTYKQKYHNKTALQVTPDLDGDDIYEANVFKKALTNELTKDVLKNIIDQLGTKTVDHAMLLIAAGFSAPLRHKTLQEIPFEVSLRDILRASGVKSRGKKFRDALENVRKDIYAAASLMIDLVEESKGKLSYQWKTRLFAVLDEVRVTQGDLFEEGNTFDYRLRVVLGGWSKQYFYRDGHQIIDMSSRIFQFTRPGPEELAKKIYQKIRIHASVENKKNFIINIRWLLQGIGEIHENREKWSQDRKWKGRLKDRFDDAVTLLQSKEFAIIHYQSVSEDTERSRGWFDNWLRGDLLVQLENDECINKTKMINIDSSQNDEVIKSGNDLRILRTQQGYSQTYMAKRLKISNSLLSQVESGKRSISKKLRITIDKMISEEFGDL